MANYFTLVPGTAYDLDTTSYAPQTMSQPLAIDTNHFLIAYQVSGSAGGSKAIVFSINTTTLAITTSVARFTYDATSQGDEPDIAKIDTNHFIVVHRGGSDDGFITPLAVNTTTWAISTTAASLEFDTQNGWDHSVVNVDGNHFLDFFAGGSSSVGTAQTFTVNTTTYAVTTAAAKFSTNVTGPVDDTALVYDTGTKYMAFAVATSDRIYSQALDVNTTTFVVTTASSAQQPFSSTAYDNVLAAKFADNKFVVAAVNVGTTQTASVKLLDYTSGYSSPVTVATLALGLTGTLDDVELNYALLNLGGGFYCLFEGYKAYIFEVTVSAITLWVNGLIIGNDSSIGAGATLMQLPAGETTPTTFIAVYNSASNRLTAKPLQLANGVSGTTTGGDSAVTADGTANIAHAGAADTGGDSDIVAAGYITDVYDPTVDTLFGDSDLTALGTSAQPGSSTTGGDADVIAEGYSTQYGVVATGGDSDLLGVGTVRVENIAVEGKFFAYKVYDPDGVFLGEYNNVVPEFSYSQEVNSAGSAIDLELSITSDDLALTPEELTAEDGVILKTESGTDLASFGEATSPYGQDALINLNNKVEVYAFFGFADVLETQQGDPIDDQDEIALDITFGSPNGRIIFTGFIRKYKVRYGDNNTTVITLNSYGVELSNYVLEDGSSVVVPYTSEDPSDILMDILDKAQANGLEANYTPTSIARTGTIATYTYKLTNYKDSIDKVVQLSPADWYWYYDMATNLVYLKGRPTIADHIFTFGEHIKSLDLDRHTEQMENIIYFAGGNQDLTGVTNNYLFKKYQDSSSIADYGQYLKVISDERVTDTATADIIGNNELQQYKDPLYTASVTILAKQYTIEEIRLGDLVEFRGSQSFVDTIQMQILALTYTPDAMTLRLGSLLPQQNKRIAEIKRNLEAVNTAAMPSTPS